MKNPKFPLKPGESASLELDSGNILVATNKDGVIRAEETRGLSPKDRKRALELEKREPHTKK